MLEGWWWLSNKALVTCLVEVLACGGSYWSTLCTVLIARHKNLPFDEIPTAPCAGSQKFDTSSGGVTGEHIRVHGHHGVAHHEAIVLTKYWQINTTIISYRYFKYLYHPYKIHTRKEQIAAVLIGPFLSQNFKDMNHLPNHWLSRARFHVGFREGLYLTAGCFDSGGVKPPLHMRKYPGPAFVGEDSSIFFGTWNVWWIEVCWWSCHHSSQSQLNNEKSKWLFRGR